MKIHKLIWGCEGYHAEDWMDGEWFPSQQREPVAVSTLLLHRCSKTGCERIPLKVSNVNHVHVRPHCRLEPRLTVLVSTACGWVDLQGEWRDILNPLTVAI